MPEIKSSRFKKLKITLQQNDYECAVPSGRMLLSLYGINMTKKKIKMGMGTTRKGTDSSQVVEFFRSLGTFDVLEYENNMQKAREYLANNVPLYICYDMFGNPEYSHYAVVTKIERGKIKLLNPYSNKKEEVIEEYDFKWFKYWWERTNFWFLVLIKKKS
jgi:ABC-type bacteriocin/lantibiotic exporter with double-glycine peptidase domain